MRSLLLILVVVLLVGFGVLDAMYGAVTVLGLLLLNGVLWRVCKFLAGGLLILIGLS